MWDETNTIGIGVQAPTVCAIVVPSGHIVLAAVTTVPQATCVVVAIVAVTIGERCKVAAVGWWRGY